MRAAFLIACVLCGLGVGGLVYFGSASTLRGDLPSKLGLTGSNPAASPELELASDEQYSDPSDSASAAKATQAKASSEPPVVYSRHTFHDGIARVAPSVVSLYSSAAASVSEGQSLANQIPNGGSEPFFASDTEDDLTARLKPGPDLSDQALPSLRRTNQGSGVIVDSDGIVLTNLHLVDGADQISVVLSTGSLHTGRLIGGDRETDLAVVNLASGKPSRKASSAPLEDESPAAVPGRILYRSTRPSIQGIPEAR